MLAIFISTNLYQESTIQSIVKARIKTIVSNPHLQSALVGILVILLVYFSWDEPIKRFNVKVDPFEKYTTEEVLWFIDDFDGDGNSERIRCFKAMDAESIDLVSYDNNGNLLDHYHYEGSDWNYTLVPEIYDINEDGIKELLYFSVLNDSIFFNAINLHSFELSIDHHYFNTFERKRDNYAYASEFLNFGDFNNDGTNELFFVFDAGFGLYPRGVFKIEFPSLKISASPTDHMLVIDINFVDLFNDGTPEILCSTSAPDNSIDLNKLSDTCSYITVLDYNLKPLFDPIPMQGRYSSIKCIPNTNDSTFFACYYCRSNSTVPLRLMMLDYEGQLITEKKWKNISNPENLQVDLNIINKIPYLIIKDISRIRLDKGINPLPADLNPRKENPLLGIPIPYDFSGDGSSELLFCNMKYQAIIYDEETKDKVEFEFPFPLKYGLKIYPFYENGKITKHVITTVGGFIFLEYSRNEMYFLLYLIYIFLFISVSGLIRLMFYFQKTSIERKCNTEKQLTELQFNSVKNQLNPHFLFNVLNSVALMINENKSDEAYDFLSLNSRMIQRMMNDAKEVKRSLKNEIQFTKDYVSVQEHRFKDRFKAVFEIAPDVNLDFQVPKMCIHTYVENAIKHGFRNTKDGGRLRISVESVSHGISITIEDNGMGRKAASVYKTNSGNGVNIMNEFYQLFEKYHGYKIDFAIENIHPFGTIVKLLVIVP